jgi:leukotriene-A4 hydrolase
VDDSRADGEREASVYVYCPSLILSFGLSTDDCVVSQSQAIHGRSLYPCQDTPAVKSRFKMSIRSPLPVVASGLPTGAKDFEDGTLAYTFQQDIRIPSYLFAVASGDIASASIGPRSVVYAGPEELLKCKTELEDDVEKFIEIAEELVHRYSWTTYNVLILPPSFPYGGECVYQIHLAN